MTPMTRAPTPYADYHRTPAQISPHLSAINGRLVRMQSAVINGTRLYSVIMVPNTATDALTWYYYFGQTQAQVNTLTSTNAARLVDINRRDAGLFDVVMYRNSPSKAWSWYVNSSISALTTRAVALGERIIDINSYLIGGVRYYAAIFLENSSALTAQVRQPYLNAGLNQSTGTGNGYFGFELKAVGAAPATALRNTTAYEPASAVKVLFHLYAMRAIAAGTAFDSTPVTYMTVFTGSCPTSGPATTTLKNAMTLMMQQSDNAMTRAVVDHFGLASIQSYASSIGLTSTHINHEVGCPTLNTLNTTSLADLTKIYEGVSDGTLLNPNYKA